MRHSFKVGLSFGLTSAVITTLGLIVGLSASTNSKVVVLGGIIVIAIADALSDAFGIHLSEESENKHTAKEIWESTISTFICKFIFALTFIVPVLFFELGEAVLLSIVWGMILLSVLSFGIAKQQNKNPGKIIAEHLVIALFVVVVTHYVGNWVAVLFV